MKSLYKTLIINEDTTFEILIEFIAFYDHVHYIYIPTYLHTYSCSASRTQGTLQTRCIFYNYLNAHKFCIAYVMFGVIGKEMGQFFILFFGENATPANCSTQFAVAVIRVPTPSLYANAMKRPIYVYNGHAVELQYTYIRKHAQRIHIFEISPLI